MDKKDCEKLFSKICPFQQSTSLYPRFFKQFKLFVDVSDDSIRPALFKEHSDSVDKVVFYFSKKLTKCQQKYSTIEKKCFAFVSFSSFSCLFMLLYILFLNIQITIEDLLDGVNTVLLQTSCQTYHAYYLLYFCICLIY